MLLCYMALEIYIYRLVEHAPIIMLNVRHVATMAHHMPYLYFDPEVYFVHLQLCLCCKS